MNIPRVSLFFLGWAATVVAAFAFGAIATPQLIAFPSFPSAPTPAPATAITIDELKNSYVYLYDQVALLTDGVYYTGMPCGKEEGAKDYEVIDPAACFYSLDGLYDDRDWYDDHAVMLDEEAVAYGDINGDGQEDAMAQLSQRGGGSGTFYFVQVFLNHDGKPVPTAAISLGDRQAATALRVVAGNIVIEHVTHLPDDAACCPSSTATKTFRWVNNTLQPVKP